MCSLRWIAALLGACQVVFSQELEHIERHLRQCGSGVARKEANSEDLKWCKSRQKEYNVVVGTSWGSMDAPSREIWRAKGCGGIIKYGRRLTCDETIGAKGLLNWRNTSATVCTDVSTTPTVKCMKNFANAMFCEYKNLKITMSKVSAQGKSRSFAQGAFEVPCFKKHDASTQPIPGMTYRNDIGQPDDILSACDIVYDKPAYFMSHDSILNLGHHMNDVMNVWAMMQLVDTNPKESLFVNFDGIRDGGPEGAGHRVMISGDPDHIGPFHVYYQNWFSEVLRPVLWKGSTVCFKKAYMHPLPGVPYVWEDWGRNTECARDEPGAFQFQKFAKDAIGSFPGLPGARNDIHSKFSLSDNIEDVRLLLVTREHKPGKKRELPSKARVFSNLRQIKSMLSSFNGLQVLTVDLSHISFLQQVALMNSVDIVLGFHGAGAAHTVHMDINRKHCCGLIELFPTPQAGFSGIWGYGNVARHLGLQYARVEHGRETYSDTGTEVDVERLKRTVQEMLDGLRSKPSCTVQGVN